MRMLLAFLFFASLPAWAEYRMFLLEIKSADGTSSRQVQSTLDPDQYRGYHIVKEGESVRYIDTWKCKGRTNDKPACKSPRDPAIEANSEAPSSP